MMLKANVSDDHGGVINMYVFSGHIYPGLGFISLSLFWLIKHCFYITKRKGSPRQRQSGSILYKLVELIPWEGSIILFGGLVAVCNVVTNPYFRFKMVANDGNFQFDSLFGWQHVILTSSVALFGIFIILADTKFSKLEFYVKPVGSFTFTLFGTNLFLHALVKNPVYSHVHNILTVGSYGTAFSFALESDYPAQPVFFIMRVFFTLLQGTFWIQTAYIVQPPDGQLPWDGYDKLNLMFVSTSFLGQVLLDFWFVLLMFCCMKKISQKIKKQEYFFLQNETEMDLETQENKTGG